MRAPAELPTTVIVACRVAGCGQVFEFPVVYRLERLEHEAPTLSNPRAVIVSTRVEVDVPATLEREYPLRVHLERHAAGCETALSHPDDPGPAGP